MALYDQLAMLLHLLREALHVCSPHGRLRTREHVRSELTLLFDMIDSARLRRHCPHAQAPAHGISMTLSSRLHKPKRLMLNSVPWCRTMP